MSGVTAAARSPHEAEMEGSRITFRILAGCRWTAVFLAMVTAVTAAAQEATPVVRFVVERFVVEGDNPLSEAQTRTVLAPFAGEHAGVDGLLAAADALERAIQDAGVAFQRVVLPPQSLQDGEVLLRVAVFKVARIEVTGARHHSEENVRRSVPSLREGETPDTGALARELAVANRQPWKSATLTFRESETDGEGLDAALEVEERRPRLLWSGLGNTGSASTGPWRWSLGGSFGNLFDRDHHLSASFTTSPGHTGQVRQWALGYGAPLYGLGGELSGYYVRSDVDTGRVLDTFDVSGAGSFGGLLYTHELDRRGRMSHRLSVGIDDRRFDTDVVLAGHDIASPPVRSRPVSLHYAAEYAGDDWGLDVRLQYARNLETGGGNDDSVYRANRSNAEAGWDVFRGGATLSWALPARWAVRGLFEAQVAGEALIPGEQFGVGGINSVRGFAEREISGDDGFRASVELWPPALVGGGPRVLFFADAGGVRFKSRPAPGTPRRDSVASLGAGLRWGWKEHVALQLDVGVVAEGTAAREHGMRGHLNLLVQY